MKPLLHAARKRAWFLAAAASVLAGAFAVGLTGTLPMPRIIWPAATSAAPDQYQPAQTAPQENEILLVYVGSSGCGFANDPALPEVIEQAKLALQKQAAETGSSFAAIGVSIDRDPAQGHAHLAKMGRFDETMTGRRQWGIGTGIWQEFIVGTPQVLVVRQTEGEARLPVASENVVVRKPGFGPIADWVEAGAPLP